MSEKQVKSWLDHSPAWRAKASADGFTPALWERWRKLSPETRSKTTASQYAKGKSVNEQKRADLEKRALARLIKQHKHRPKFRASTVKRGVRLMTLDQLHAVVDRPHGEFLQYISRQLRHIIPNVFNPFFYQ